jgi:hypothetical protein
VRTVKITEQNADKFIDKKMQSMTKIASIMGVVNEMDEELIDNILSTVTGKKTTSKRSGSDKPDNFDPFGDAGNKKSSNRQHGDEMSIS